ncbi:hypothetical protein QBC32DRAFT_315520 [Pseudoneurospora amorphoporcata]|uniref:Uncharacterized protein n=1 Tax=Pseudoneurospora amorphoporcata TaxID=241081 RepID=A0AAN6NVT7_9PEZI|nr:hypothetical protein QBC32DRAFT_315520 [Pseudoneurospora amorphoporcata]
MRKFVTHRDILLCLGDVIGDRYLLQNLTCRAFAAAFECALFRVYTLNSSQRLRHLLGQRQKFSPNLKHHGPLPHSSQISIPVRTPSHCTVLDLHCHSGWGIDQAPSELRRFRGLKELSLHNIPDQWDEYVEAITTFLINSPDMETLRVMAFKNGPKPNLDPCFESLGNCEYGLLPLICERFAEIRWRDGGSLDGNERPNIPCLKLREVTVDHHSMNRFILDIPDPDLSDDSLHLEHYTGNHQKPLYLGKLTDLQYLERLHIEMIPNWTVVERLDLIRLPNLTPAIALRLRSLTISPVCTRESYRWHNWVIENNFLEYARQVSLGRLEQVFRNSRVENLIFDWTGRVSPYESLYTLLYLLKPDGETTNSLRRLEINTPGDWTKLLPALKDTLSHLRKLKYFHFHLVERYPPLCLSWKALKREISSRPMEALAKYFFKVQPSLQFVEVNYVLYQVVRWDPGTRDLCVVEVLDREREWVAPEDTPWQGPEKDAVPFRKLL